jgi:ankyrin repeat protein
MAGWDGDLTTAKCLLSQGADPNFQHPADGATALFAASCGTVNHANRSLEQQHVAVIRLLVASGADVNLAKTHADEGLEGSGGQTPLDVAAKNGYLDRVRCLVELGADTTARTEANLTPLMTAVMYRKPEVAAFLSEVSGEPIPSPDDLPALPGCPVQ